MNMVPFNTSLISAVNMKRWLWICLHNGTEYFMYLIYHFQKVSFHRNETARSNVLPTVNKYFNCGAENFVQIICKFKKVSCYRNETARSNILPTVNKHFNSIALDRFELTLLIYVVNNWNCYYRYCWKMSQRSPEIKIIVIYFKYRCHYCSLLK